MKTTLSIAAAMICVASPVLAAHANPWASEGDTVDSQFHESNQARSVDTPGEDEMRGTMIRAARGKLDGSVGARGAKAVSSAGTGGH
ncbi:hypothetical protein ACRDNQ_10495 [Palleronia sp. KMU-117]|uniref:hypothetical protein n=1 Tax=Palleronia sp. KMU-117 TaxID=3434108 RepID=UPI003D729F0C